MVVERGECGTSIVAWHFIVHGVPSNLQIHRVATKGFWDCGIVFIVFVIGCSHWFVMGVNVVLKVADLALMVDFAL